MQNNKQNLTSEVVSGIGDVVVFMGAVFAALLVGFWVVSKMGGGSNAQIVGGLVCGVVMSFLWSKVGK